MFKSLTSFTQPPASSANIIFNVATHHKWSGRVNLVKKLPIPPTVVNVNVRDEGKFHKNIFPKKKQVTNSRSNRDSNKEQTTTNKLQNTIPI
jgi:hypothetical protein